MQVVPTEYRYISKEVLPTNQFSVSEYYSPINQFDRTWPGWFYIWHWLCSYFGLDFHYCFPFLRCMQLSTFCMIYHPLLSLSRKSAVVFFILLLGYVLCSVEPLLWQVLFLITDCTILLRLILVSTRLTYIFLQKVIVVLGTRTLEAIK